MARGRDAHMPFHHVSGETLKLAFQMNGLDHSPVLARYEARSANTATSLTLAVRTAKLLIISHASMVSSSLICWPIHYGSSKFAALCTTFRQKSFREAKAAFTTFSSALLNALFWIDHIITLQINTIHV